MLDIWARLAADKKAHIIGGLVAAMLAAVLWRIAQYHLPLAVAVTGIAFGVGFEVYQKIRHEGQADWGDAAASALAFEVLAIVLAARG